MLFTETIVVYSESNEKHIIHPVNIVINAKIGGVY
jgi:hypothetical protein